MENSDAPVISVDSAIAIENAYDNKEKMCSPEQPAIKISSCTREQLLEMLAILEAELQARDITLATFQNEKLRHMLYEAKFGKSCLDDPYLALERDGCVLGEDLDEDMLMRAAHEAKLNNLENLLAAQHNLVEKIRAQVQLYQTKYSGVCSELAEERKRREQEATHSEKTNQTWEGEISKLREELSCERNCVKAYQEDLALMISVVESMRFDIAKHKKVALMLIKERKLLAECLLKDRQRLKELEDAAIGEDKANVERAAEERVVRMSLEKQVMEDRLKQEEFKHKTTRSECDRLRQQVDYLQSQLQQQQLQLQVATGQGRQSSPITLSNDIRSSVPMPSSASATLPLQRSASITNNDPILGARSPSTASSVVTSSLNTTPFVPSVTGRVPLDNAPAIAQRALAPPPYSYRSPTPAVSSSTPSIVSASSSVQPFQNQINLNNRSPAISTPVTPSSAATVGSAGIGGPRLNFLPGQSAVLTTSSGQRISLHVSPSKTVATTPTTITTGSPTVASSPSPMVVHVAQSTPQSVMAAVPSRPGSASVPFVNAIPPARTPQQPTLSGTQRPVPPTPTSPVGSQSHPASVAVSSSFNITIRPDSKGVSTFIGAASSTPPEPPARLGLGSGGASAFASRSQNAQAPSTLTSPQGAINSLSSSSGATYQLESPTEATRYLTIKKIGVAASHSLNN